MNYFFGTRDLFGIEVVVKDDVVPRLISISYWISNNRCGDHSAISSFEAHSSFHVVRDRVQGIENCCVFSGGLQSFSENYEEIIALPEVSIDYDVLDSYLRHSLWFHHSFGGACIMAASCNGMVKVCSRDFDSKFVECALPFHRFCESIVECDDLLQSIWLGDEKLLSC